MLEAPSIEELENFTLESYVKLLQYLSQIYKIVPFREIPREDVAYLILRHDVDFSLHEALKMAQIERELGIRSTYFVLFSSVFYNLFEGDNVSILREISEKGHEIGLHYRPSQYRSYGRNVNKTLNLQRQMLEHFLSQKVFSISRDGPWDRDPFATTREYINANHPYFRGDLYIHDSCRAWTRIQGLSQLLKNPPKRVQLLIHPQNWQDDKVERETLLERSIQILERQASRMRTYLEKVYATDPLVLEYDRLTEKGNSAHSRPSETDQELGNSFGEGLEHYNALFRWYVINTSWGWGFHLLAEKIRNAQMRIFGLQNRNISATH